MPSRRKTDRRRPGHKNRGQFKKGRAKTGGRKKGTPNKFTTIKQAVLNAFETVGGERYLVHHARRSSRSFLNLIGKLLPKEITGADGGPLELQMQRAMTGIEKLSDAERKQFMELMAKIIPPAGGA